MKSHIFKYENLKYSVSDDELIKFLRNNRMSGKFSIESELVLNDLDNIFKFYRFKIHISSGIIRYVDITEPILQFEIPL